MGTINYVNWLPYKKEKYTSCCDFNSMIQENEIDKNQSSNSVQKTI